MPVTAGQRYSSDYPFGDVGGGAQEELGPVTSTLQPGSAEKAGGGALDAAQVSTAGDGSASRR